MIPGAGRCSVLLVLVVPLVRQWQLRFSRSGQVSPGRVTRPAGPNFSAAIMMRVTQGSLGYLRSLDVAVSTGSRV
jgi:hypothetical protein